MIGISTTTNVNTESQAETVLSGETPLPNTILPTSSNNPRSHATVAHQTSKSEGCESPGIHIRARSRRMFQN